MPDVSRIPSGRRQGALKSGSCSETAGRLFSDFRRTAYSLFGSFFEKRDIRSFSDKVSESLPGMSGPMYLSCLLTAELLLFMFFTVWICLSAVFFEIPFFVLLLFPISGTASALFFLALPAYLICEKRRKTDAALPDSLNYFFTLSAAGLSPEKICLSMGGPETAPLYGDIREAFAEIRRSVFFFGMDIVSAISDRAGKTVSPAFSEFLYGLASVIETGSDFSVYLAEKKKEYAEKQKNRHFRRMQNADLCAEMAAATFLGGPMFFLIFLYLLTPLSGSQDAMISLLTYRLLPGLGAVFLILADIADG